MPHWFQFSANARKDTPQNHKRKYAEPNSSTMNRICAAFDDIGNINLNYAKVEPFNWQMLLSRPCPDSRLEIAEMFCELDSSNLSSVIESQETTYANEKQLINNYNLVAEDIILRITEKYGLLEEIYPYIAKFLFAGDGMDKSVHKRMFWRVFGEIALKNIKENLKSADVCTDCGLRVPSWVRNHQCIKNQKGFYACIDCGKMCERINSRQWRCDDCQFVYNREQKKARAQAKRDLARELKRKKSNVFQPGNST